MEKLRKVVQLRVFDFDTHQSAYAVKSNKNKFGYMFQNQYYRGEKLIYQSPEYDNVEDQAFYWLALRVNRDQLGSLKRRVDKLMDHNVDIVEDSYESLYIRFSEGSMLTYQGKNKEQFCQKVLTYKS